MGTECEVAVTVTRPDSARARRALTAGRAEVDSCERVLSRFDERSDLSRLNRAAGAWCAIDERLVEALRVALRAREETGGKVRPDYCGARRRRVRPLVRAAEGAPTRPCERLVPGSGHRDRRSRRPCPHPGWCRRRPRRDRQGVCRHTRAVGNARGMARPSGRARRSRRRHRRLGRHTRGLPLASRDRRPALAGRADRDDRDRRRRRRNLGTRHATLRARRAAPSSDRPDNRSASGTVPLGRPCPSRRRQRPSSALPRADHPTGGVKSPLRRRPGLAALLVPFDGDPVVLGDLPLVDTKPTEVTA